MFVILLLEVIEMPKERILPGKIAYEKLFTLMERKGIKKTNLRYEYKVHPTTIQKIVNNETINTDTIIILCHALNCQPGDIMEYIPDSPGPDENESNTQTDQE